MREPRREAARLGDLVKFRGGHAFPQSEQGSASGAYPFIKVRDMNSPENAFRIRAANNYVSLEQANRMRLKPAPVGAVVFAKIGEALRHNRFRELVQPTVIDNNMMAAIVIDEGRLLADYLRHLLPTLDLPRYASGTSVPYFSAKTLASIEVNLPPLPIQRRIAAILSAYDDLIEVHTRRIAILEEMARRVYEDWFVRQKPDGTRPLSKVAEITMGQSPKSEFYNEGGTGLPFHQGVADYGVFYPTDRLYCSVSGREAQAGDILMSVRAPVGRINVAPHRMIVGRGLSAIRSRSGHQAFLLAALKTVFQREDSMGSGTIFNSVSKRDVESISIPAVEKADLDRYEEFATPIWGLLGRLVKLNANLRAQRDLLLPLLVSGKIDVSQTNARVKKDAA